MGTTRCRARTTTGAGMLAAIRPRSAGSHLCMSRASAARFATARSCEPTCVGRATPARAARLPAQPGCTAPVVARVSRAGPAAKVLAPLGLLLFPHALDAAQCAPDVADASSAAKLQQAFASASQALGISDPPAPPSPLAKDDDMIKALVKLCLPILQK